jgi:hypothetical protein
VVPVDATDIVVKDVQLTGVCIVIGKLSIVCSN